MPNERLLNACTFGSMNVSSELTVHIGSGSGWCEWTRLSLATVACSFASFSFPASIEARESPLNPTYRVFSATGYKIMRFCEVLQRATCG